MDKQEFELHHCERCGFMTDGPVSYYAEVWDLYVCDTCVREYERQRREVVVDKAVERKTRPSGRR